MKRRDSLNKAAVATAASPALATGSPSILYEIVSDRLTQTKTPLVRLLAPGVSIVAINDGYSRLTTLSARPFSLGFFSPSTMLILPLTAIFSRTS